LLSIETSCDDTCISILEVHPARNGRGKKEDARGTTFKVLADSFDSQIKIHVPYGGVYPMLAKREHIKNLPIILEKALREAATASRQAKPDKNKLADLIAVTYGPGLEPCLWAGITFAKELAEKWGVPVIPVNHMEGHIFSVFGRNKGKFTIPKINFPALSLLVSGGHTELVLIKKWAQYEIIGETLDDAVGEAFDKVARMLGLPYPGGPQISKLAEKLRSSEKQALRGLRRAAGPRTEQIFQQENCDPAKVSFSGDLSQSLFSFSLPRPMLHGKNFDFSFSGLKTAVLYLIRDLGKEHSNILQNDKIKQAIALEFENAATECLVHKTKKAVEKYKIKTLIVAGGVACNKHLQKEMKKTLGKDVKLFFPTKGLAGDNSLMIGIAGYLNYKKNKNLPAQTGEVPKLNSIKATGNLRLS